MADYEFVPEDNPIGTVFDTLDGLRANYIKKVKICAEMTFPYILPSNEEATVNEELTEIYNKTPTSVVGKLATKLATTLVPIGQSPVSLVLKEELRKEVSDDSARLAELEDAIVTLQNILRDMVEKNKIRPLITELMKNILITGNGLLKQVDIEDTTSQYKASFIQYRFDKYVIERDYTGDVVEIITKDTAKLLDLSDAMLEAGGFDLATDNVNTEVTIYTRVVRVRGKIYEYQNINEAFVEGSLKTYSDWTDQPFIPIRSNMISGDNYGKSMVSDYLGDIVSLEAYSQQLAEYTAIAGRILLGAKGAIDPKTIMNASNGDVVRGDLEEEISVLSIGAKGKMFDIDVLAQMIDKLEMKIKDIFLDVNVRDSERTTATEIRYLAGEIDKTLGGLYSLLAVELQIPLAEKLIKNIQKVEGASNIESVLNIEPVSGVSSIHKNEKKQKLYELTEFLASPVGQVGSDKIKASEIIQDFVTALGLKNSSYIKTQQEVEQEQAQAQEQAILQQGASQLANTVGANAGQNIVPQPAQPPTQ